jgi:hypothetical protein
LICFKEMDGLRTDAARVSTKLLTDRFYLQPKWKHNKDGSIENQWAYNTAPMGKGAIAKFVPSMCEAAGIPRRTNHSLRASATTDLKNSGVPDSVGMQVTRHKSIAAYNKYDHPSDKQQRALATKRRATQLGQGEGSPPSAKQLAVRTPRSNEDISANVPLPSAALGYVRSFPTHKAAGRAHPSPRHLGQRSVAQRYSGYATCVPFEPTTTTLLSGQENAVPQQSLPRAQFCQQTLATIVEAQMRGAVKAFVDLGHH